MFVSSTRGPFVLHVTVMFRNPADGPRADRAHGAHGAARRRRDRRLHAVLRHERMQVAMNLATVHHHSFTEVRRDGGWCAGGVAPALCLRPQIC